MSFNPSKCTHLEQWAADTAAPGEQSGVRCLAQGSHLSRGKFLPEPRFEPTTSGYKSDALSIRAMTAQGNLTKVPNEPPVQIGKPQKTLERSAILWGGTIRNSFYLGGIHSDTFGRENKIQGRNRPCLKLTLLHLGE